MEWLRRNLSRSSRNSESPNPQSQSNSKKGKKEEDEEFRLYGITEELINHVKSFTIDTFKNFPLQGSPFIFSEYLALFSPLKLKKIMGFIWVPYFDFQKSMAHPLLGTMLSICIIFVFCVFPEP